METVDHILDAFKDRKEPNTIDNSDTKYCPVSCGLLGPLYAPCDEPRRSDKPHISNV